MHPDGTCLFPCSTYGLGGRYASFTSDPTLYTVAFRGQLIELGIDGVVQKLLLLGRVSDPVWSSRGELAAVRGGWIWAGSPGSLRRLARGTAPSWSPDGGRIVFDRNGWLMVRRVRARVARRLVRGSSPAWSPDGRWIAFFATDHRLSIVQASGGDVRPLGMVTGNAVDWQPLPAKRAAPCLAPPESVVAASTDSAIVTFDTAPDSNFVILGKAFADEGFGWAAMGCRRADGRERVLAVSGPFINPNPSQAAVAGNYAAVLFPTVCSRNLGGTFNTVELFDLRTGAEVPNRGGETAEGDLYPGQGLCGGMDQLALGSDAVSAVHAFVALSTCGCTVEQIEASDSTGVRTLDSITDPAGSPTSLTNLTLMGDTLTWDHSGSPRSVQLQP